MIATRQLYVMVSQTNTGVARLIRAATRYPYNHVSLTLDPDLRRWYSFARYVQDAPLYSGFICESVERLCDGDGDAQVRIFRVEIPERNARRLEQLLEQPDHSHLIYNYFDALVSALGIHLPVPDCHTCLSFACEVLGQEHLNIRSLCEQLEPCRIYEGSLADLVPHSGSREDPYFSELGLVRGSVHSVIQLGTLTMRTVAHGFSSYMAHRFHRTVQ